MVGPVRQDFLNYLSENVRVTIPSRFDSAT